MGRIPYGSAQFPPGCAREAPVPAQIRRATLDPRSPDSIPPLPDVNGGQVRDDMGPLAGPAKAVPGDSRALKVLIGPFAATAPSPGKGCQYETGRSGAKLVWGCLGSTSATITPPSCA